MQGRKQAGSRAWVELGGVIKYLSSDPTGLILPTLLESRNKLSNHSNYSDSGNHDNQYLHCLYYWHTKEEEIRAVVTRQTKAESRPAGPSKVVGDLPTSAQSNSWILLGGRADR